MQAGIRHTIVEKEVSLNYRSNEWTMAIHWSLDHLEQLLPPNLWTKLAQTSCNPSVPIEAGGNYPIINGETGDLLAGVPYAKGLRVPRSKMRALCAEGIDVQVSHCIFIIIFLFRREKNARCEIREDMNRALTLPFFASTVWQEFVRCSFQPEWQWRNCNLRRRHGNSCINYSRRRRPTLESARIRHVWGGQGDSEQVPYLASQYDRLLWGRRQSQVLEAAVPHKLLGFEPKIIPRIPVQ